ncbi:MAG: GntR family transcriptional regulator, partial [Pseudorhodobacter sp.]
MSDLLQLPEIDVRPRPSVTDQVYETLLAEIVDLNLPPGSKISEVEVAGQMGVSRQPVRDAFFRLSKQGFLTIRPQRATTISLINPTAVMQARFVRAAIEAEMVRIACERLTEAGMQALEALLEAQRAAVEAGDRARFHLLDDAFHREICIRSGFGFAWATIHEHKMQTDRVRLLSLAFAAPDAYGDHLKVMEAIRARDPQAAMAAMRDHLSRIKTQIIRIRADNLPFFVPEEL